MARCGPGDGGPPGLSLTSPPWGCPAGFLKEGCELINEALNLFNNVYGAMHVEICACLRLLARLHYIMGDYAEALSNQQKAVLMSERVMGIEHPNTIQEYMHLALYCFASSQLSTALSLLYRARYLTLLVFGEDHPEMALLDVSAGAGRRDEPPSQGSGS